MEAEAELGALTLYSWGNHIVHICIVSFFTIEYIVDGFK